MSVLEKDLTSLKVKQIEPHTFTKNDRAVIVLGTGATRQVLLFIGPSDAEGFLLCSKSDLISMSESELGSYIVGLFKVWVKGSSFLRARSITAETGGTICGFELNEKLCLEINGNGAQWLEEPISRIYFSPSK